MRVERPHSALWPHRPAKCLGDRLPSRVDSSMIGHEPYVANVPVIRRSVERIALWGDLVAVAAGDPRNRLDAVAWEVEKDRDVAYLHRVGLTRQKPTVAAPGVLLVLLQATAQIHVAAITPTLSRPATLDLTPNERAATLVSADGPVACHEAWILPITHAPRMSAASLPVPRSCRDGTCIAICLFGPAARNEGPPQFHGCGWARASILDSRVAKRSISSGARAADALVSSFPRPRPDTIATPPTRRRSPRELGTVDAEEGSHVGRPLRRRSAPV